MCSTYRSLPGLPRSYPTARPGLVWSGSPVRARNVRRTCAARLVRFGEQCGRDHRSSKTGLAFLSVSGAPIWTRAAGTRPSPEPSAPPARLFFRPEASRPGKGFAATGGSRGELGVENVSYLIWCSRPLLTGLECWPAWKVPQWRMRRCN